jgi:Phage Mu protein F like protein
MAFDATNPEAVAWVEQHAAELVTNVTESTRDAIRLLVTRGFEEGIAPRDVARLLREGIGLTERDATAVLNRRAKLLAEGKTNAEARKGAEKYATKLLNARAETISRTEAMKASNEGQAQLWSQAQAKGLLSGDELKTWITADPCPICAPLDGETVPLNSDFSVGQDPPLHPRCKCTVGLAFR